MTRKSILCILALALLVPASGFAPLAAPLALTKVIYDDALGAGWSDWSWATVNLAATQYVHGGSKSISVAYGAWQGLYLHKAGADTLGATHLRFYLHGGGAGGQQMNLFLNLQVGGVDQNGPAVAVPPPPAGAWVEVSVPLATLNPGGATVTGITWQGSINGNQPMVYFDDIAFTSAEDPNAPQLSEGRLLPRAVPADGTTYLTVRVMVSDPQGAGDITGVTLDASALGRGTVALRDDGRSNDGAAGDGVYGAALTIAPGTTPGEAALLVSASDQAGHQSALPLGVLSVLGAAGGNIPAGLPQRIAWGSNAWSETPGDDWQVNSGVAWDYVYQYITWGWESWGGNFVSRFVNQAWGKGYVPVVTVYMILGVPPDCGETSTCYAQKLQNASTVANYLASLQRALQEANGSQPVIFNLEPDFYGYMQQLSNSATRPPGVVADQPSSYPVALNKAGYPNNLSGFGRYIVDLIHNTAPNALAAPMASMWATNGDPQSVTALGAIQMAQRTAAFIDAMGGAQADLLVVEWSDRDSGRGIRPWWDDLDQELPRPTRAILWENALSRASGKRLLLWQVPAGNMSLDNASCNHYQDNRPAYAFSHPRDLADAGVIGVLFGGGDGCSTQVWTDGGFIAAQGAIAYANPATPGGLSASSPVGPVVGVRWNESSEPDRWGYRLVYRKLPAGSEQVLDVGRRNAASLVLPEAGAWEVRVRAYDAMKNESGLSAPVTVTTFENALRVFLPTVRR